MYKSVGKYNCTYKYYDVNFHPLEVVPRWRDPQLQVAENHTVYLFNLRLNICESFKHI